VQESGTEWSLNIPLQEHIHSSANASCLSALWHFEASPGAMTCETIHPFIGCGAHSAVMGDGSTGSFCLLIPQTQVPPLLLGEKG
jgi:hypothetical protein